VTGDPVMAQTTMPTDTFESRAADYGLDPATEWNQLVDLVFYERFIPDRGDGPDPDGLWLAPTVQHARKHRQKLIKAIRGKGRVRGIVGEPPGRVIINEALMLARTEAADDPLEFLRENAPISADHMRVKAQHTHRRRNQARADAAGRSSVELADLDAPARTMAARRSRVGARESAEVLARRLLGPQAVTDTPPDPELPYPTRDR
jgi:hypothetical protein